jgi:hypothetical protein
MDGVGDGSSRWCYGSFNGDGSGLGYRLYGSNSTYYSNGTGEGNYMRLESGGGFGDSTLNLVRGEPLIDQMEAARFLENNRC